MLNILTDSLHKIIFKQKKLLFFKFYVYKNIIFNFLCESNMRDIDEMKSKFSENKNVENINVSVIIIE